MTIIHNTIDPKPRGRKPSLPNIGNRLYKYLQVGNHLLTNEEHASLDAIAFSLEHDILPDRDNVDDIRRISVRNEDLYLQRIADQVQRHLPALEPVQYEPVVLDEVFEADDDDRSWVFGVPDEYDVAQQATQREVAFQAVAATAGIILDDIIDGHRAPEMFSTLFHLIARLERGA